jgi:predicted RNase H-like HicB family nuclease
VPDNTKRGSVHRADLATRLSTNWKVLVMAEVEHYTYVLAFSAEDNQYVGTVVEFPSLSWLANSQVEALAGIAALVKDVVAGLVANGEPVPEPLADSELSDEFEALLSIVEDHAIAPMVAERLAAGGGRPFDELLNELGN